MTHEDVETADHRSRPGRPRHRRTTCSSAGRDVLVVDAKERVGDGWRQQWDTLRLYSPAQYDGLPGMAFPAPPWSFPGKDEVADYLESYAARFDLPVRLGQRVDRLDAPTATAISPRSVTARSRADNVVVATGTFGRTPNVPDFADRARPDDPAAALERVPPALPAARRTGPGGRGLALRHRHRLRGRREPTRPSCAGATPARSRCASGTPMFRVVFPLVVFVFRHVLSRRTPMGRKEMDEFRFHGGPDAPGQARRPARARRRAACTARVVGVRGRPAAARRRSRRRRGERRLVHRLPAGVRLDRPAGLRRATAGRRSCAVSSTARPGCSSAVSPSRSAASSMLIHGARP